MRYADMIKGHVVASLLFYPKGQKRERDRWHQKERHKQKSSNNMRNRQKAKGRQGTAVAAAYLRAYEYAWAWVHCTAGTGQSPNVLFSAEGPCLDYPHSRTSIFILYTS
jgi:hypothetical protein